MAKQMQIQGTETNLSMACDDLIELYDEVKKIDKERAKAKEACDTAKERVAEIMVNQDMKTLRHAGLKITARVPAEKKATVTIKEE